MTLNLAIALVLLAAYVGVVVGALAIKGKRSRGREALDALALPLSIFTSKHHRGRELSAHRVILGVLVTYFVTYDGEWNWEKVVAMAVIAFALPVADLFAAVPVGEGLAALVAIFGATVAKRIKKTTIEEEEPANPTPVDPATPMPPDHPTEEPDGDPGK